MEQVQPDSMTFSGICTGHCHIRRLMEVFIQTLRALIVMTPLWQGLGIDGPVPAAKAPSFLAVPGAVPVSATTRTPLDLFSTLFHIENHTTRLVFVCSRKQYNNYRFCETILMPFWFINPCPKRWLQQVQCHKHVGLAMSLPVRSSPSWACHLPTAIFGFAHIGTAAESLGPS